MQKSPAEIAQLREAIMKIIASPALELDEEERTALADSYWEATIRAHIARQEFRGAWYRIQLAALGNDAFNGVERICRGHVEGEPVELIASPKCIMGMVHILYYALMHSGTGCPPLTHHQSAKPWGDLFPTQGRVAEILSRHRGIHFALAAQMERVITDWCNNYRSRRALTAA